MNISIRNAILQNLNNANYDVVKSTIEDAITIEEEKVLPGLGVMFELVWNRSTPEFRDNIINSIVDAVK